MPNRPPSAPRCAAIVGPYLSGKTSLFESLLKATGAIKRKGTVGEGNTVGDTSAEARKYSMSVELNIATTNYLGDEWTFIDCPGSVEFYQEPLLALKVVDVAVVVVEPETAKVLNISPVLQFLDQHDIPHMIFINKIDSATDRVADVLEALRNVSTRPLVLREIPFREDGAVAGFVDLVSERAWHFTPTGYAELVEMPEDVKDSESEARQALVEALADFDDDLLEQILEDIMPEPETIYSHLATDLRKDLIVPVFFGSATADNGVIRLLKALRHEVQEPSETAERLGVTPGDSPVARCFKTYHHAHVGKTSMVRVFHGSLKPGAVVPVGDESARVGGLTRVMGDERSKLEEAVVGQVVAISRMEKISTGSLIGGEDDRELWVDQLQPLYSIAIAATQRADEVKLAGALHKLQADDPSFVIEHTNDTHELLTRGQGEIHLRVQLARLEDRFGVKVSQARPQVPYKETIRGATKQHARFKRQTGGHGQFGDVHVEIGPNVRGGGLEFSDRIVGGVVPKRFIPAVEQGVKDYMTRGPLGFPVVDIKVELYDGSYHAVDSSEMAFKTAGGLAMKEGMPKCSPVLLEPVYQVQVYVPNEFTARMQRVVTGRRGQILGFEARRGWSGWDALTAYMPEVEMGDMILELRSLTLGVGTYTYAFDHLSELTGRLADDVVKARAEQLAAERGH